MSVAPPLTVTPLSTAVAPPGGRSIGSLWRRILAFVLDGIIIGIAANVIALPFFEAFSHLGAWGRLLGFCLALPYFAILDSKIGDGQTLGKRWMHVQVVDKNGNTISLAESVVRYTLFAIPYYLNGIALPITRTPWIVSSLFSVLIFVLGGATVYLVLCNRHTRQGVHDLAVGSYVTDADTIGPLKVEGIWKMHWVILGVLLILVFVSSKILGDKVAKWGPFPQLLEDARLVEGMEGVQSAGVQDLTWSGSGASKKVFVVNVIWTGKSAGEQAFASQVARVIIRHDSMVQEHDLMRIVMIRGFDLGIAHTQISTSYEHTPAEWNALLFGTSPTETPAPAKI